MKNRMVDFVLSNQKRLAMPLGVYAGLALTGGSVWDAADNPRVQYEAQIALQKRYQSQFLLTGMDPTLEAEIFGAQVNTDRDQMPTISGRLITSRDDFNALIDPKVGHKRTGVPLSVVQWMRDFVADSHIFILGSVTGPLTLAAQLYGIQETIELLETESFLLKQLLEIATKFLLRYAWAFREVGADGIVIAEPAAGMVSPVAAAEFSSSYVRRIVDFVQNEKFGVVYHNCEASLEHLPALLQTEAHIYHFGAPMDLLKALDIVGDEIILSGNLDPVEVLLKSSSGTVFKKTNELLQATAGKPNFIISAGCQFQPNTPLENLDAFFQAVSDFNQNQP